jgi:hypothetical protein
MVKMFARRVVILVARLRNDFATGAARHRDAIAEHAMDGG